MKLKGILKLAQTMMSGQWAIQENELSAIRTIYNNFTKDPEGFVKTMNYGNQYNAGMGELFGMPDESDPNKILSFQSDTVAVIEINGPLVDVHNCATIFFGACSYADIIDAIDIALEKKPNLEKIIFNIESPGGMVAGCDNAALKIKSLDIKTEARVGKLAASAGFWLASQCDVLIATSETAMFGSIGVVIEYWDGTRANNDAGFDLVQLTSTDAPDKRVDAKTPEGAQKIVRDLDEIHKVFVKRVALGRKTTTAIVNERFGRGGVYLSEQAKKVGMIDNIKLITDNIVETNIEHHQENEMSKTLQEFLDTNADAKKEYDSAIAKSATDASEKAKPAPVALEEISEKKETSKEDIESAKKIISSKVYSQSVKDLAVSVITGESSIESLNAAVSAVDELEENKKSDSAQEESESQGETPAPVNADVTPKNDGVVDSQESFNSSVSAIKNAM